MQWKKTFGYLMGKAWFNPLTPSINPVLSTAIPQNKWIKFDKYLALFGIMSDDMKSIAKVFTESYRNESLEKYRSPLRRTYCLMVDMVLLINLIRMIVLQFFVTDLKVKYMWGDMSQYWTRRPHFLTVPIMALYFLALVSNLMFELLQKQPHKKWLLPFSFMSGDITPAYARMRSVHQVNLLQKSVRHTLSHALFLVIFWTLMAGFAFFGTAVRFAGAVSPPLGPFWISIVWSGIQTLMAFYVTGAIIFSVAYFHCVAWYFRIRFKRLNKIVFALLDQRGVIPASKRAEFMREVVYEHSSAAHDVAHANRFWKFYLMACYFIYVPIEFWLLYTACYYFVGNWVVKLISWVAFLQIGFLFSLIIASGEMVQNQAHLLWKWLNTLCLYPFPIGVKLKMANLLERLGGPTVGFTCYDFFVVARETLYDSAILIGTYFLLVVDFIISHL